jgi:transcriptional regulator with XRE-family HTH domain
MNKIPTDINTETQEMANRLTAWIEGSGLNKAGISRALGVHPSYLSQWVRGDREISAPYLRGLCVLGCDINWLLTGKIHP